MSAQDYYRAINQAQLQGFTLLADVLYMLYLHDHPEAPRKPEARP